MGKRKSFITSLWLAATLMVSAQQGSPHGLAAPGMPGGESGGTVRVAGIVLKWIFADREANLRRAESLIREAAAKRAKIVCTAESFLDGYSVRDDGMSEKEFRSLAEPVPGGPFFSRLQSICRELEVYLIAGLTEKADGKVFNSAALIGPDGGLVGTYRKKFLWPTETGRYAAGDSFPVFATRFGRIGMMICSDRRNPEPIRELAANKAEIVFCLAGGGYGPENDLLMRQRSKEGGMPIVFVHPVEFLVTGPAGEILAQSLHGDALDEENKDSSGGVARVYDLMKK